MSEKFPEWDDKKHEPCRCELFPEPHQHVSADDQESGENDVPRVHHVHDSDISGAAQRAG